MAEITIRISDRALKIAGVFLGTFILAWLLIYVWSSGFFAAKYQLRLYLPEVAGLVVSAPVRVDGMDVGTVAAIKLAANPVSADRKIELILKIEKRYEDQILSDSVATVITEGLLGNRFVSIQRGFRGSPIPPGGEIPVVPVKTLSLQDFLKSFTKWADCVNRLEHETEDKPQGR
jgi:phospholipid/cholesterol/gamma-HCH transport system substrate-binding protein